MKTAQQLIPSGMVATQVAPSSPPKAALSAGANSALITAGALVSGFLVNAAAVGATDSWPHFSVWASHNWIGYLIAQIAAPTYRAWDAGRKASAFQNQ